jgi:hypothetical protein
MVIGASLGRWRTAVLAVAAVIAPFAATVPPASAAGCEGASCSPDQQGQGADASVAAPAVSVDIRERRSGDLYRVCVPERGEASGWCSAYLMGVADTLAGFGDGGDKGRICAADYTIETLAETFMTWARANDALQRTDMLAGAGLAFRQRWPC